MRITTISNCCKATLIPHASAEGTGYYSCDKCGLPCDMYSEPMKQPTLPTPIEKAFDEKFSYDYVPGAVCQTSQESHVQELKDIKQWFAQTLQDEVKKAVAAEQNEIIQEMNVLEKLVACPFEKRWEMLKERIKMSKHIGYAKEEK